jgi:hypothetical protein
MLWFHSLLLSDKFEIETKTENKIKHRTKWVILNLLFFLSILIKISER